MQSLIYHISQISYISLGMDLNVSIRYQMVNIIGLRGDRYNQLGIKATYVTICRYNHRSVYSSVNVHDYSISICKMLFNWLRKIQFIEGINSITTQFIYQLKAQFSSTATQVTTNFHKSCKCPSDNNQSSILQLGHFESKFLTLRSTYTYNIHSI